MQEDIFFKTEEEVREFFKGVVFKFEFLSDGEIYFNSLERTLLNGELIRFSISLYHSGGDFFCYSSFKGSEGWLDKFQISSVETVSTQNKERKQLYFSKWQQDYNKK